MIWRIAVSLFLLATLVTSVEAFGQQEEQIWTSGQLTKVIPDSPWRFGVEGIYRHSRTRDTTLLQSFRTIVGYKLESDTVLTFIHESGQAASDRDNEVRFIAQASHRFAFEAIDLGIRLRHEHRLFQDSKVWLKRSRVQFRLGLKSLQFLGVTPFTSQELMYLWNTVEARAAGSTEVRLVVGGSIEIAEGLSLDLAYQDRRTYSNSSETRTEALLVNTAYVF